MLTELKNDHFQYDTEKRLQRFIYKDGKFGEWKPAKNICFTAEEYIRDMNIPEEFLGIVELLKIKEFLENIISRDGYLCGGIDAQITWFTQFFPKVMAIYQKQLIDETKSNADSLK